MHISHAKKIIKQRPLPPSGDHRRRTVGLLGGSFNPAHPGHQYISRQAIKSLSLNEVWWLVSPQNPLKDKQMMLSLPERVRRAQAIANHPKIRVTDIERRLGTQFTADTLTVLQQRFPCIHFVWLMGADNMVQIPKWDRWQTIFKSLSIAVFDRKPYTYKALNGTAAHHFAHQRLPSNRTHKLVLGASPRWVFLPCRRHPASATDIRQKTGLDKLLKRRKS